MLGLVDKITQSVLGLVDKIAQCVVGACGQDCTVHTVLCSLILSSCVHCYCAVFYIL